MLTIDEAFSKFKAKISEPTDKERNDASRRQRDIREHMDQSFDIDRDFLSGSYARHTKTKPLKDVDIVCVLGPDEKRYREKGPAALLDAVANALVEKYGRDQVEIQRRSVSVSFGAEEEETVMSFDVVPAYDMGKNYEVPDKSTASWIKTDPEVHKQKAIDKHQREKAVIAFSRHADDGGTPFVEIDAEVRDYLSKSTDDCVREMFSRLVKDDGAVTAIFPFQQFSAKFAIDQNFDATAQKKSNQVLRTRLRTMKDSMMKYVDRSNPRAVTKSEHYLAALDAQLEICDRTDHVIDALSRPFPGHVR